MLRRVGRDVLATLRGGEGGTEGTRGEVSDRKNRSPAPVSTWADIPQTVTDGGGEDRGDRAGRTGGYS